MNGKTITTIGNIKDTKEHILLKMWSVTVPAGRRPLIKHQHLNFEIMTVNSGSGTYTTASGSYPITKGDVFVFSSNEWHCITDVGKSGLCITNLQFDPLFIRNSRPDFTHTSVITNSGFCFQHHPSFQPRIESDKAVEIVQWLSYIQEDLLTRPTEYMLSIKAYLHILLTKLVRGFGYLDETDTINKEQLSHIHHALSYIDAHFTKKITLQELSELAGLTPNYFCSLFKQVNGMTIWDYVSAKRIDKAIQLLTTETHVSNILDIATDCGYNSTANFNKTFKKITGMTPKEYRSNRHSMIS